MNFNILNKNYEDFKNRVESDNLDNLINLENEIIAIVKKYSDLNNDLKTKIIVEKIRSLLIKICRRILRLESKLINKNKKICIESDDNYYNDNQLDNCIGGSNYVIYGSDLDPLDDPFQDILDLCN